MKLRKDWPLTINMTMTALLTTIGIITLGIYDLCAVVFGDGTSTSVSRFLINVGMESPMFVFGLGYVAGHLTGYCKITPDSKVKANNP